MVLGADEMELTLVLVLQSVVVGITEELLVVVVQGTVVVNNVVQRLK